MRSVFLCLIALISLTVHGFSQVLKPGFDKAEYIELLKVTARQGDTLLLNTIPPPEHAQFIYRSAEMGLENRWDLYIRDDQVAILSIRGTTASMVSWMANFYAAMVPAVGQLHLSDTQVFKYHLADNPRAAVHIGWLLSTAYLSASILPKLDSLYRSGVKNVIVMGHSQGGAIAYLLTAYLYELQHEGRLAKDIHFKTYCSAAPKPGNLYFAYDYENRTRGGWAYNVVNSADWVPETPISIQKLEDFNKTNLFAMAPAMIKKQKFPKSWIGRYVFNRLRKPTDKAQRRYEKYLGRFISRQVIKQLPAFVPPDYYHSNDYVRTGNTIVLYADADYYRHFPDSDQNAFIHHMFAPYYFLVQKLPDNITTP